MPDKKRTDPPVRTLDELLAESKRLEQRGRELTEQARALAAEVAKAKNRDRRGGRRGQD